MSSASLSPEYAQFRRTFFVESAELLADMEDRLQRLVTQGLDREEIDAVFRAVHSIKAGAGMFQYGRLVAFAHAFEALLDRLRDERIGFEPAVAHLVIRSADILAELVSAAQEDRTVAEDFGAETAAELDHIVLNPESRVQHTPAPPARTWKISFSPKADLLRHANEPLLVLRELGKLGQVSVACDCDQVPTLDMLAVDDIWLSWQIELAGDCDEAAIREVFEFVEDDADIRIEACTTNAAGDDGFGLWLPEPAQPEANEHFGLWTAPAIIETPVPARDAVRSASKASGSIRVDLNRIDRLVNTVGELITAQAMLRQQLAHVEASDALAMMEGLTRDLQDCVMAVRMQPVKSVFSRMPRLVRELADKLGKSVRLTVTGELTELDKTVLEELSDPLTHMIRNSIDHGIEMPDVRLANGKLAEGTIRLSAAHVGSNILIHIEDDGAGISRDRVLAKAIEKGIVPADARLSDEDILDLIFAPGFSTAAAVSDVSGRGVGMDVVRRNIQKIGGRIQLNSTEGQGSRFCLVIPLTLAVIDGMLLAVGDERYVLPLTSIIESFRPQAAQVRRLADGTRIIQVRGNYLSLVSLGAIFSVPEAQTRCDQGLVVVIETATGMKLALLVDDLLGQQQVVIKSLSENYAHVPGISGATILGDGRVALILDIEQLDGLPEPALAALAYGD